MAYVADTMKSRSPWAGIWACALAGAAGTALLTNPYMLGIHGTGAANWDNPLHVKIASLLAVFFYFAAPLAVYVGQSIPLGRSNRWKASWRVRFRLLGLVTATFAGGLLVAGLQTFTAGDRFTGGDATRIAVSFVAVQQLAAVFYWISAACAVGFNNRRRAMVAVMAVVVVLIVGLAIVSDLLLFHTYGKMPLPGSPEWFDYLSSITKSAGILVFYLSPTELYLTLMTGAIGAVSGGGGTAVFAIICLAAQNAVTFLAFAGALAIRKRRIHGLDIRRAGSS